MISLLLQKKVDERFIPILKSKDEIYLAVVESELDILSDMMKRVAEKNISPDDKLLEMIYTRLDAVKEVVYRNGTLRAYFFRDIWRVEKVRKKFDAKGSPDSLKLCFWKDRQREFFTLTMWR